MYGLYDLFEWRKKSSDSIQAKNYTTLFSQCYNHLESHFVGKLQEEKNRNLTKIKNSGKKRLKN